MNRNQRRQLAEETVRIVKAGCYTNAAGRRVDVADDVARAVKQTTLHAPESLELLASRPIEPANTETAFEVCNETTLAVARRLVVDRGLSNVLALNFASAKHAGGGFLGGSQAQEESLARSSALYETLLAAPDYYRRNLACGSALYTHHMILSRDVPVFRDDDGGLLDAPYNVSYLTAPAVNAGAVRKNQPKQVSKIGPTMRRRIELVLTVCAAEGFRHLVLGAWGCGVFHNEPTDIAEMFASYLIGDGRFSSCFETIVFAVLDGTTDKRIIGPFRERFASVAQ